jgi:hypothetical protein
VQAVRVLVWFICTSSITCIPTPQSITNRTQAPAFNSVELTVFKDQSGVYNEGVYLTWTPYPADSVSILYYTLLRKFPGDSLFDVFTLSQRIPSTVNEFYDKLDASSFPTDSFDILQYKIFSVDNHGRFGDTSAVRTLTIAPQPSFDTLDQSSRCIRWSSWVRGSQTSFVKIWSTSPEYKWVSASTEAYPRTDEPAIFTACVNDSALQLKKTRLHFALFLQISEARSVRAGFLDIP